MINNELQNFLQNLHVCFPEAVIEQLHVALFLLQLLLQLSDPSLQPPLLIHQGSPDRQTKCYCYYR